MELVADFNDEVILLGFLHEFEFYILRRDTGKRRLPETATRSKGDEVRVVVPRVVQQLEFIAAPEQERTRLRHPM